MFSFVASYAESREVVKHVCAPLAEREDMMAFKLAARDAAALTSMFVPNKG